MTNTLLCQYSTIKLRFNEMKSVISVPIICLIQHYVIKFVSDLQQVRGFLRVIRFNPPIKITVMILLKYG